MLGNPIFEEEKLIPRSENGRLRVRQHLSNLAKVECSAIYLNCEQSRIELVLFLSLFLSPK